MVFKIGCAIPLLFISVLSDNFLHVSLSEQVCDSSNKEIGFDWTAGEESVGALSKILLFLFVHHDFYVAYGQ